MNIPTQEDVLNAAERQLTTLKYKPRARITHINDFKEVVYPNNIECTSIEKGIEKAKELGIEKPMLRVGSGRVILSY